MLRLCYCFTGCSQPRFDAIRNGTSVFSNFDLRVVGKLSSNESTNDIDLADTRLPRILPGRWSLDAASICSVGGSLDVG
jgi:hypothetical protein